MGRVATETRERVDASTAIAFAGLFAAGLAGVALAAQVPLGIAVVVAIVYLPIVFVNLPLAVCLWIPVVFLEGAPALNLAGKAAGLLLALAWVGAVLGRRLGQSVLARHRRLFEVLGLLVVWLTLSLAWAPNTPQAAVAAWQWWAVALVFVIVATTITSEQLLVLAAGGYVVGALLSVLASAATGTLGAPAQDGRISGSVGDPNFLAAALISAVPVAFALATVRRGLGWRWLCLGAVGVLAVGVVTTQSRGGLIAAVAMWIAALIILPRRKQVLVLGAAVLAAVAVAFALNPGAWQRVTTPDTRGTGRIDIWTVAWNMFEDHPARGVGLANFGRVAPSYVRSVGPLEDVDLVIKSPDRAVHNSYLELLSENGVLALILFVVFVVGCLRAALAASRTFEEHGRSDLAALTQAIFLGAVGLLASYFFISGSIDRRLWILLGLGLAALEIAHRMAAERAATGGIGLRPLPSAPDSGEAAAWSARP